jgi:16S rRNA (cytosine967-C5)-methyltransferase
LSAVAAISPARKAAFEILLAVERGHGHSDDLLRGGQVGALYSSDKNLATALVLGVLRWQIRLDHELRPLLKRPKAKLDVEVMIALRIGAFQLWFLDRIPAHAAIDESVELAKQAGHRFAARMVNAVLRRAAEAPRSEMLEGNAEELALSAAHPAWLAERWASFYGLESARAICRHGQEQSRLTIRVAGGDVDAELARAGFDAGFRLAPGELLENARTVLVGDLTASEVFRTGRARIQDEGSQLIGEFAACAGDTLVLDEKTNDEKNILDACAAPGGKTLILAERNPEARIVACEVSPKRLDAMRERLDALRARLAGHGNNIECRLADAAEIDEEGTYDLVLADVPCSGTGTLGRNPEIRHRLRLEDLARHAERQRAILRGAMRAVRPGGRVVYSTCSLEPEENEQVVAAILAENLNTRQVSLARRIDDLRRRKVLTDSGAERLRKCLTPEGALRLLPGAAQTDGFYVALLERTE